MIIQVYCWVFGVLDFFFLNCFFLTCTVNQGVYSRTDKFDGNVFQILTVQDMARQIKPPGLWLNIQVRDILFSRFTLSLDTGRFYTFDIFWSQPCCSDTSAARCILRTTQFEYEKLCTFCIQKCSCQLHLFTWGEFLEKYCSKISTKHDEAGFPISWKIWNRAHNQPDLWFSLKESYIHQDFCLWNPCSEGLYMACRWKSVLTTSYHYCVGCS